ncbi:uncharacterized protein LOC111318876, partial [Stylophora pistillata]
MYIQLTKDAFQALGVSSSSVNAIGNLTETDFPIEKVRKLEDEIRKELQAEITFLKEQVKDELMSMRSDVAEANQERRDEAEQTVTEIKEEIQQLKHQLQEQNKERKKETSDHKETIRSDIAEANQAREKEATLAAQERKEVIQEIRDLSKELELAKPSVATKEMSQKLVELNQKLEDITIKTTKQESNPILPKSNLPSMVPYFTGRDKECNDVIAHATNEATRLVSIWGSPGFGKTSTAIAEGHRLQAQGLSIYFVSLRGMRLKSDLTSKFLGLFTQPVPASQRLTADDELCRIFAQIPNRCIFILDNADDLFESDLPNVKEDAVTLIEELLNRSDKVTFLLTTRESCEFLNLRIKGHHALRIRELDEQSSSDLVQELLPEASKSDRLKVAQICGSVPLAMKLLCCSISGDNTGTLARSLDMFLKTTDDILAMLDNPDYPSNLRLKSLFDASFQRLSAEEREALVSFCILPEHFDLEAASAVLGIKTSHASRVLQRLQRKSLIDSSSKAEKYCIHKLILSFVQKKGESDMKDTLLNSKVRFFELYISLFETLTKKFLAGYSMSAFLEFFQNEESFVHSLIDGCLEERTVDKVCNVLTIAEMYLSFLYWIDDALFGIIYETAIKAATDHDRHSSVHKRLLLSKAYGSLVIGATGETKRLLLEAKQIRLTVPIRDTELEGKLLSYRGLYKFFIGKTKEGMKLLENAISSMETIPMHRILKLIILQVLALYHSLKCDPLKSADFYKRAVNECKAVGDTGLMVIPEIDETRGHEVRKNLNETSLTHNQPLQTEVIILVSRAIKNISTDKTKQSFSNLLLQIMKESESTIPAGATGRFRYHFSGVLLLDELKDNTDRPLYYVDMINFHPKKNIKQNDEKKCKTSSKNIERTEVNYAEALESEKRSLNIKLKVLGEDHLQTADSYHKVGVVQHSLGDFVSALESKKRALDIRLKALGEDHSQTADSYDSLGVTQHSLGDFV